MRGFVTRARHSTRYRNLLEAGSARRIPAESEGWIVSGGEADGGGDGEV